MYVVLWGIRKDEIDWNASAFLNFSGSFWLNERIMEMLMKLDDFQHFTRAAPASSAPKLH